MPSEQLQVLYFCHFWPRGMPTHLSTMDGAGEKTVVPLLPLHLTPPLTLSRSSLSFSLLTVVPFPKIHSAAACCSALYLPPNCSVPLVSSSCLFSPPAPGPAAMHRRTGESSASRGSDARANPLLGEETGFPLIKCTECGLTQVIELRAWTDNNLGRVFFKCPRNIKGVS